MEYKTCKKVKQDARIYPLSLVQVVKEIAYSLDTKKALTKAKLHAIP